MSDTGTRVATGRTASGLDAVVTVVVLAGGESRRFDGDKLAAPLAGTTVLGHLLTSLPPDWVLVVVGPPRPTPRPVTWVREDPPGGGPLAGVARGLEAVTTGLVAVVAGDMPYAGQVLPDLVTALRAAGPEVDGVIGADGSGHANPLLAAYRVAAVRAVLPVPAAGRPAKVLLRLAHLTHPVDGLAGRDVDTRADLAALSSVSAPPDGHSATT